MTSDDFETPPLLQVLLTELRRQTTSPYGEKRPGACFQCGIAAGQRARIEVSSDRGLNNSRQWSSHTDPGHCCGQNGLPVTEGTISPAVPYPTFEDSFPTPTGRAAGRRAGMEVSSNRGLSNSRRWSTHTDPGHCCGQIKRATCN